MKTFVFVAVAIVLAGCGTDDESWLPSRHSANAPHDSATAQTQPVNQVDVHCRAVAHQRAADARANGYSFDMETTIYDGTYKDCVAWYANHPG